MTRTDTVVLLNWEENTSEMFSCTDQQRGRAAVLPPEERGDPHSDRLKERLEPLKRNLEPGAANQRDCRGTEKIGSSLQTKTGVGVEEEGGEKGGAQRSGHHGVEEWRAGRRR